MSRDRHYKVSDEFREALFSSGKSAKEVSLAIKCSPWTFYKLLEGVTPIRLGDPRIMAACGVLNFCPGDAFMPFFPTKDGGDDGEES